MLIAHTQMHILQDSSCIHQLKKRLKIHFLILKVPVLKSGNDNLRFETSCSCQNPTNSFSIVTSTMCISDTRYSKYSFNEMQGLELL